MLKTGFEPVRIAPRDFKSPASAVSPLQLIIPYAPRNPANVFAGRDRRLRAVIRPRAFRGRNPSADKNTRATRRNPTPVSSAPELYGTVRVILPLAAPPSDMRCISKKSDPNEFGSDRWRHHPDSDRSIKVLQTFALPLGYGAIIKIGAVDETRTRDLHLGKVALYQLSYYRIMWCLGAESNHRHADFQSTALPTELPEANMATRKGLEPSTSSVTGWRSNQLNYRAIFGGNNRARTCDPLLVRQSALPAELCSHVRSILLPFPSRASSRRQEI